MFKRLQSKWKVSSTQLFLVLCVFAIAGSATGWIGKIIMTRLAIDQAWLWTAVYIVVITLIWPINVLIVSIPFGQFLFFRQYLTRMATRMKILNQSSSTTPEHKKDEPGTTVKIPFRLAVFASGTGSNARRIIEYFHHQKPGVATVSLIVCNNPTAGVLRIAEEAGIKRLLIDKERFFRGDSYLPMLIDAKIDFVVLAGFLWKVPQKLIDNFRYRIINIHPALLPKFGGKGMYGLKVHKSVIDSGETASGITIHFVDEHYDNGDIIFQSSVTVDADETPETLAQKIHTLEHEHYPLIIERLLIQPNGR